MVGIREADPREISQKESLINTVIKIANEQGNRKVAEGVASLGGASASVIRREILPAFISRVTGLKKIKNINTLCSEAREMVDTLETLNSYGIEPVDLVDEAVSFFLEKKLFYFALSLAGKGSEDTKEIAVKTVIESCEGNAIDFKEIIRLKGQTELSSEDLNLILKSLRKNSSQK